MSEVQFNGLKGNYGFYQKDENKPVQQEEAAKQAPAQKEAQSADPNKVLDAMNLMGQQNLVHFTGKTKEVKLSDERITSIEDSMAKFEEGVNKYADAIRAEFGSVFSEDTVLALAANAFARGE